MSNAQRRTLSLPWIILVTLVLWLVMLLPPVLLASWVFWPASAGPVAISLLAAPVLFLWAWKIIRTRNQWARWLTMQYLGVSAVLLPFALAGAIATIWFDRKTVAVIVVLCWFVAVCVGIASVIRVAERRLSLSSSKLDRHYRLVQLSDVHIGSRSSEFLQKLINQASQHNPDAILITGDLLDLEHVNASHLAPLKLLTCPTYLCLGNHERYVDLPKAVHAIESNQVQVLRNRSMILGTLQINGVDDQNQASEVQRVLERMSFDLTLYQILLYHRPDGWRAALQSGMDLTLAGHTHAGQIWPFGYLVRTQFRNLVGHFEHVGQHLYVSPGSGTWGPTIRLGTRSEMTIIDLAPATKG